VKRIILLVTTVALACGLTLGIAGGAMASTSQSGEGRGLFGTVESVAIDEDGAGSVTLSSVKSANASDNGTTLEVKVTAATVYHIPTVTLAPRWQTWPELTDDSRDLVKEANRVAVLLADPASNHIAQRVMVVPAKGICRYRHQLGMVTGIDGTTATVTLRNGQEVSMTMAEGMELGAGQVVVVVTEKSTGEVQLRAVSAYRWEHMVQRFEGYMNGSLNQAGFDNATAMLQKAHERHIAELDALRQRLEERNRIQAAERVGLAVDYSEARFAEALQLRDQIRARVQQVGWDEWMAQWGETRGTIVSVNTQTRAMTLSTENGTPNLRVATAARITKSGYVYGLRGLGAGDVGEKVVYSVDTLKAWYVEVQ